MMKTYIVTVYEKFSDTPIIFKCVASSENEVITKYKLTGSDIVSFKIIAE